MSAPKPVTVTRGKEKFSILRPILYAHPICGEGAGRGCNGQPTLNKQNGYCTENWVLPVKAEVRTEGKITDFHHIPPLVWLTFISLTLCLTHTISKTFPLWTLLLTIKNTLFKRDNPKVCLIYCVSAPLVSAEASESLNATRGCEITHPTHSIYSDEGKTRWMYQEQPFRNHLQ